MLPSKEMPAGAGRDPAQPGPEKLDRRELIGRTVLLSDGRRGEVIHVEYEAPGRVALVRTFRESPSPLTRVAVDRHGPSHLPVILELIGDAGPGSF